MIEPMSQKVFTFGYCTSSPHKGLAQVLEESRPVLIKRKTWQQLKSWRDELLSLAESYNSTIFAVNKKRYLFTTPLQKPAALSRKGAVI